MQVKPLEKGEKMQAFVGIDVSKKWLNTAMLIDGEIVINRIIDYKKQAIKDLVRILKELAGSRELIFGCEATGQYHKRLAYQIYWMSHEIRVINPRLTHHYKQGENITSETDSVDAVVIARRLSERNDRPWTPADEGDVVLRELLLRREQLKQALNREKNRLDRFENKGPGLASTNRSIKFIRKELDLIEEELHKHIKQSEELHKTVKLLRTIPGVGFLSSVAFVARIGDPSRFDSSDQVVKYLGLSPSTKQSGSSVNKSSLSKKGDRIYRKIIYLAAVSNSSRENIYGDYFLSLKGRGKNGKTAIVGLMRKMTRVMFAVWRDQKPYSEKDYGNPEFALPNS